MAETEVNEQTTETPSTGDDQASVVRELQEFKQRFTELEKAYTSGRRRGADVSAIQAEMDDVRSGVNSLLEILSNSDLVDEEHRGKLKTAKQHADYARYQRQALNAYADEIGEVLEEVQLDWEADPKLEKARKLWQDGKPMDALKEVHRISRQTVKESKAVPSDEELEKTISERTDKAVEEALRKAGVYKADTGESTAAPPGKGTDDEFMSWYGDPDNVATAHDHLRAYKIRKERGIAR
jgi:soluble cytochrome b562